MERVGFIGLGTMGSRMSANLVKDGYDLRVFDIQEDAVEELVELGAEGAESAEELARQCDVVMLSLPGPDQVVQVVDDIRDGLEAGDVVIDLTTSTPATTNALGEELESKSVDVLSAPVSGGRSGAKNATLSVMVGGDRDVFETCRPLFDAIGSDVFYIGDQHGDGHAMKLVNNYLSFVAMICTAEAVSIGEEVGLELETMIDVFNQSSARNTATTYKYPEHVIPGEYDMNYEMGLVEKDMQLLMDVSRDTGVPFMVGGTIRQMIAYIRAELGKDADYTEIYKYFDEIAADGAETAKK
jgi:3-hydroxyisobutyrate dehydrogenase